MVVSNFDACPFCLLFSVLVIHVRALFLLAGSVSAIYVLDLVLCAGDVVFIIGLCLFFMFLCLATVYCSTLGTSGSNIVVNC